jgi:hypothetical protein
MDITQYTCFDLPIPYKKLKLYPVAIKEYAMFNTFVSCLLVDKNSIPDAKIISMSNLDYLYYTAENNVETTPLLIFFDRLLNLCLKEDDSFSDIEKSILRYRRNENKTSIFTINEEEYTADDFENIKQIICEQNLVDLPDDNISKEVRDSLEQARIYKNKQAGSESGSFEDYIISLSIATGWSFEYIYSLSIRKFTKAITRMDNFIHYKIYLAASMSGMVEYKDKSFIKHWLTNLDTKSGYGDVTIGLDEVKNKISLESAK